MSEAPSPYSTKIPGLQLVWDSTSLLALKTCSTKYLYRMIRGYQAKARKAPLTFGSLLHKGLERYDIARVLHGESHDQALEFALWQTLHEAGEITDGQWRSKYDALDKPRSIESLARTIVWYTEHFQNDPAQTVVLANGKPAVELSFRFEIGLQAVSGEPFLFSGHLDRLVEVGGAQWVMDRKHTTSSLSSFFFDKFAPDNQMSGYSLASKIAFGSDVRGVMIDGIQIGENFSRFRRGFTYRSPQQLDEWLAELKFWLRQAEAFAVARWWPRNDTACHHYHKTDGTGGCEFREICSRDASVRENFLKTDFVVERWNPLETR